MSASVPRATYRLQLHADFGFAAAAALVPYLAALGISHLYASPILRARPGSRHGYDVVRHDELNPELGTRADFDRLVATLHDHGMGLVVDIVPNHMGVLGGDNAWWLDVLENGQASRFAEFFDIDWHAADRALAGRVLVPLLGDQYGLVLERGELALHVDPAAGSFTVHYYEHRLPVDPACYATVLDGVLQDVAGWPYGAAGELRQLAERFRRLPPRSVTEAAAREQRHHEAGDAKGRLAALLRDRPAVGQAVDRVVARLNGQPGQRRSFDALDRLLDAQAYRLAHWRVAGDEINYRRFFDVHELATLRMEREAVFEATHRLVLALVASGAIDGLRIDHPDGLADPAGYFRRLQQRCAMARGLPDEAVATAAASRPTWVAVEKITAPHEKVPADWAVSGTTGYRFANVVNGVLVDPRAKARLERVWHAFVRDEARDFDELAWHCRLLVMDGALAGELTVLATALLRLAREDRRTRDFTLNLLRGALAEVVAAFPVYRTYVVDRPSDQDRRYIDWAIARARRRSRAADASVFDFIRRVLLGRPLAGAPAGLGDRYRAFARRLQQYTAPVAAKGIEDTALYRHHRLVSVNDVGGDPDAFGMTVTGFHGASRDRAAHWPRTMLATSTHDAKRSEDVRTRIDVISEMPAAWRLAVRRWSRMNRRHRRTVNGVQAPSRNDEYLLYQTLVGSLPAGADGAIDDAALSDFAARVEAAMLKSARESKAVTSWISPDAAYEAALSAFVQGVLERRDSNLFLADLLASAPVFAWHGALNGLSMALLKCLSPGVPDFYQGHETITLSLVDPDNRRPVDWDRRRAMVEEALALAARPGRGEALRALVGQATDGRAKCFTVVCGLALRARHEALCIGTGYLPLEARGERADHVVAFARHEGGRWVVAVATRLSAMLGLGTGVAPIGEVWGDTAIAWPGTPGAPRPPEWLDDAIAGRRHALVDGALRLADVLRDFPVAALEDGS